MNPGYNGLPNIKMEDGGLQSLGVKVNKQTYVQFSTVHSYCTASQKKR